MVKEDFLKKTIFTEKKIEDCFLDIFNLFLSIKFFPLKKTTPMYSMIPPIFLLSLSCQSHDPQRSEKMSSSRAGISVLLICLFLFFSACFAAGFRRFPLSAAKRVSPAYYSANHNMAGDEGEEVSDDLLKKVRSEDNTQSPTQRGNIFRSSQLSR